MPRGVGGRSQEVEESLLQGDNDCEEDHVSAGLWASLILCRVVPFDGSSLAV